MKSQVPYRSNNSNFAYCEILCCVISSCDILSRYHAVYNAEGHICTKCNAIQITWGCSVLAGDMQCVMHCVGKRDAVCWKERCSVLEGEMQCVGRSDEVCWQG